MPVLKCGDTVVMDNLPAHKVSGIRERIEAAGARPLNLPADDPDFNLIERAFAKLKAILRAEAARMVPHRRDVIKSVFGHFMPGECRNDLAAAGYDAQDTS